MFASRQISGLTATVMFQDVDASGSVSVYVKLSTGREQWFPLAQFQAEFA
jgi:hypothetical protein